MFAKTLVKGIVLIANFIVVSIMLFVLVAAKISPQLILFPAYFSLAFPFVIFINIGFVLIWILARQWYFLLSLLAIVFMWSGVAAVFPVNLGETQILSTDKSIKVLSYNTMLNAMLQKHSKDSPNEAIQYILDQNADIVCLQEFAVSPQNEFLTLNDIQRIFKSQYPYSHLTFKYKNDWSHVGAATFSKFPLVHKDTLYFDSDFNLCQYSDLNVDGQTIRVINVHLESNRLTQNDKAMPFELKDNFNAEKLSGTTRYLSRKLAVAYRIRAVQADSVAALMCRTESKIILCGDFNDVPLSYSYSKVRADLKDAFIEKGLGMGLTFNESIFRFRIDYIMCSDDFKVVNFVKGDLKASDHYPIMSEIIIESHNK